MKYDYEIDENLDLIDAVHSNRRIVSDICRDMESLAQCFSRTGNSQAADEIYSWIVPLIQSAKQVSASFGTDLNRQYHHSQETAFGLLAVAFKRTMED